LGEALAAGDWLAAAGFEAAGVALGDGLAASVVCALSSRAAAAAASPKTVRFRFLLLKCTRPSNKSPPVTEG